MEPKPDAAGQLRWAPLAWIALALALPAPALAEDSLTQRLQTLLDTARSEMAALQAHVAEATRKSDAAGKAFSRELKTSQWNSYHNFSDMTGYSASDPLWKAAIESERRYWAASRRSDRTYAVMSQWTDLQRWLLPRMKWRIAKIEEQLGALKSEPQSERLALVEQSLGESHGKLSSLIMTAGVAAGIAMATPSQAATGPARPEAGAERLAKLGAIPEIGERRAVYLYERLSRDPSASAKIMKDFELSPETSGKVAAIMAARASARE